jgi:hypothetical protein
MSFREQIGRVVWLLALLLLFAGVASAQRIAPIEAPKPKPEAAPVADKKFWAVVGILGAAKAADGFTSAALPHACVETDPVLGRHPSDSQYASFFAATFAVEVGIAYLLKRYGQHHRWARHLWLVEPSRQTGLHIYWAAHNEALVCR